MSPCNQTVSEVPNTSKHLIYCQIEIFLAIFKKSDLPIPDPVLTIFETVLDWKKIYCKESETGSFPPWFGLTNLQIFPTFGENLLNIFPFFSDVEILPIPAWFWFRFWSVETLFALCFACMFTL